MNRTDVEFDSHTKVMCSKPPQWICANLHNVKNSKVTSTCWIWTVSAPTLVYSSTGLKFRNVLEMGKTGLKTEPLSIKKLCQEHIRIILTYSMDEREGLLVHWLPTTGTTE